MKIQLRTNLDLSTSNASALDDLSNYFTSHRIVPPEGSVFELYNVRVAYCAIAYRIENSELKIEIEVNVPKKMTVSEFHEVQRKAYRP